MPEDLGSVNAPDPFADVDDLSERAEKALRDGTVTEFRDSLLMDDDMADLERKATDG